MEQTAGVRVGQGPVKSLRQREAVAAQHVLQGRLDLMRDRRHVGRVDRGIQPRLQRIRTPKYRCESSCGLQRAQRRHSAGYVEDLVTPARASRLAARLER